MAKVINIFDPKEKPYGWLSNNYRHFMTLNGKGWKTVTNYIYANLLTTPMYNQFVRETKNTKDVLPTFLRLYQDEVNNITRQSIEEALKVKFEDKDLAEKLLATGDAPIYYASQDILMGIGPNNDGQNLYGKYLSQIRHSLRVSFRQQKQELAKAERDQNIYDTYLAEEGLVKAIRNGNDLKEFLNKTSAEIVERLGRADLERGAPRRDVVLEMAYKKLFNTDLLNAIEYPKTLVSMIRKKEMRKMRLRKIKEQKEIVFDMYADYLLEKHFQDLKADQYAKAKEQQFGQMDLKQKNDLENRLYDLFEKGMLSSRLSDAIDARLNQIQIPTEKDVEEAENVLTSSYGNKPIEASTEGAHYVPEKGEPILVYPGDFEGLDPKYKQYLYFSPIAISLSMLNIQGRKFPTVTHYIIANLIAHLPSFGGIHKAYPQILANPDNLVVVGIESFGSPDDIGTRYLELLDIDRYQQLEKYLKEGLNKKFEDRVLQDILLMTGDAKLVYNDFSDAVIGTGPKGVKGWDYTGKYLMELRAKYAKLRKDEKLEKLETIHISAILDKDPFMKDWSRMRIRDMCKVLMTVKNYLNEKEKIDTKLNAKFAEAVLDKIYQPCSHVFGTTHLITVEVPQYFREVVQECPGFSEVGHDTIEIMWKRIAVIIYYLINYMEESNIQNLRSILGRIELMVSKGGKCIEIVPDEYDNCIVSALINLIKGIIAFNKEFSYSIKVTERDVKIAASIILNADVSDIKSKVSEPIKPEDDDDENLLPIGGEDEEEKLVFQDDDDENLLPIGGEDEEEKLVFQADSEPDEGEEFDYGEEEEEEVVEEVKEMEEGESSDEGYSPRRNMIIFVLKEIDEVEDHESIALVIEGAIETIKTYPMSKQVKRNRINFFATQRS